MRIAERSGSGGGGGGGGFAMGTGGGAGCGSTGAGGWVVEQATISSIASISGKRMLFAKSVTETNTHDVYFGGPESAACDIQLVKIIDRPDVDTKVITIVDSRSLHP